MLAQKKKGVRPFSRFSRRGPPEPPTPFDSALRRRRPDLHLQDFPLIDSHTRPASPREWALARPIAKRRAGLLASPDGGEDSLLFAFYTNQSSGRSTNPRLTGTGGPPKPDFGLSGFSSTHLRRAANPGPRRARFWPAGVAAPSHPSQNPARLRRVAFHPALPLN